MLYRSLLFVSLVLLSSGCQRMTGPTDILDKIPFMKSSEQLEGEAALEQGDYDRAVGLFRQASQKNPEDERLQATLQSAQERAADFHLKKALEAELSDDPRLALEESKKAVEYSDEALYSSQLVKARDTYDMISAQVEMAIDGLSDAEDRRAALQRAEALRVYGKAFPALGPAIVEARKRAGEELSSEARTQLRQQAFDEAYATAKEAMWLSQDKGYESEVIAYQEMVRAERRRVKGDYLTAVAAIDKAARRMPDEPFIAAYKASLVKSGAKRLSTHASLAIENGKYLIAIRDLETLRQLDPAYAGTDEMLRSARTHFVRVNLEAAKRLEESSPDEAAGRILMHYLIAQRHDSDPRHLDDAVSTARERLDEVLEMRVSIELGNVSMAKGVEVYLRAHIIEGLQEPTIRNLRIVEPEAIRESLRDLALETGDAQEETMVQAVVIRGLRLGIKGTVEQLTVQEKGRDEQTYQSIRYQNGTRYVLTPEASRLQAVVDAAQEEVDKAQMALKEAKAAKRKRLATDNPSQSAFENPLVLLDQTYAENDIESAQKRVDEAKGRLDLAKSRLPATPSRIEEPVYIEGLYPIYDLSLVGELRLEFRLIDLLTSKIGQDHLVHVTDVVHDRYIPGDKRKGIVEDPDELPSKQVFKVRLLDKAVKESVQRLRLEFGAYAEREFYEAQRRHKLGDEDEAIEHDVRFLVSTSMQDSKKTDEVKDSLRRYYGVNVVP